MMARVRFVVILVSTFAIALSGFVDMPTMADRVQQDHSWTIMVYMADDYSSSLVWRNDFNELESALQASGTDIIVLVDPLGSSNSALYRIEHDPNYLDDAIVSSPIEDGGMVISGGEVNMAASSTLASFLNFSMSTYHADNYVLVLWGHGGGWRGLCPDGADILTLPELSDALSQATEATENLLDLIVVDSCAEATLETLWQVRSYARYFAASEIDVPLQGLPYDVVMNDLAADPNQGVEEFAEAISHDYVLWTGSNTDYSATMGVFNLSAVEPLVSALNAMSIQCQKYDLIFHDVLRTAFNSSEGYEEEYAVDFGHLLVRLINADLPLEIRHLATECLLKCGHLVERFEKQESQSMLFGEKIVHASGMTVYAPSVSPGDAEYGAIALALTDWYGLGRLFRTDSTPSANGQGPSVSLSWGKADLTWQDDTDVALAWVFLNLSSGLSFVKTLSSDGPSLSIVGIPGHLTLATSSYVGGALHSYRTVNVTLEGNVTVEVQVVLGSRLVENIDLSYDIKVIAPGNVWLNRSPQQAEGGGDSVLFSVRIPVEALVGDSLTVNVHDRSSGEIVGTRTAFVPMESTTVRVEVIESCGCQSIDAVPMLFALLPGLLILLFAISLYYDKRKGTHKDE